MKNLFFFIKNSRVKLTSFALVSLTKIRLAMSILAMECKLNEDGGIGNTYQNEICETQRPDETNCQKHT